jgi:hypothetical protein
MHASTAPQCLVADERSGADAARQRLTRKSRFNLFASLRSQRHLTSSTSESKVKNSKKKDQLQDSDTTSELSLPPQNQAALVPDPIHLDDSGVSLLQDDKDVYRWAVLYENQRGCV